MGGEEAEQGRDAASAPQGSEGQQRRGLNGPTGGDNRNDQEKFFAEIKANTSGRHLEPASSDDVWPPAPPVARPSAAAPANNSEVKRKRRKAATLLTKNKKEGRKDDVDCGRRRRKMIHYFFFFSGQLKVKKRHGVKKKPEQLVEKERSQLLSRTTRAKTSEQACRISGTVGLLSKQEGKEPAKLAGTATVCYCFRMKTSLIYIYYYYYFKNTY